MSVKKIILEVKIETASNKRCGENCRFLQPAFDRVARCALFCREIREIDHGEFHYRCADCIKADHWQRKQNKEG